MEGSMEFDVFELGLEMLLEEITEEE